MRKISDKPQLKDVLQNNSLVLYESVQVIEDKKKKAVLDWRKLRKHENSVLIWNTRLDPGAEKRF